MRRTQLIAGLALLVAGLVAISFGTSLPHGPPPLTRLSLQASTNTTLLPTTDVPSNATVPIPGVPHDTPFGGNITVLNGEDGSPPPVSFYLLDAADWASYNATFAQGARFPTSFVLAEANRSSIAWTYVSGNDTPFALLLIASGGGFANVTLSAYASPTGGAPRALPVPPEVEISPGVLPQGRWEVSIGALNSLALDLGGSFNLSSVSGTGATLYVLNPNGSTACPSSTFLPTSVTCKARIALEVEGTSPVRSTNWSVPVFGLLDGWTLVFLSSLYRSSILSYDLVQWDLPSGPVLDASTVFEAIGAIAGFFGFLAASGAIIRGRSEEEDLPAPQEQPSDRVAPSPFPAPSLPTGPRPRSLGFASAPASMTSPGGPGRSFPPALHGPSVPVRATCGSCGTGYPIKGGRTVCPVCGSKSVVDSAATGVELL